MYVDNVCALPSRNMGLPEQHDGLEGGGTAVIEFLTVR